MAEKYIGIKSPDKPSRGSSSNLGLIYEEKEDGHFFCEKQNASYTREQILHDLNMGYLKKVVVKEDANFVLPKVFFIGATAIDLTQLEEYLTYTDQVEFLESINEAKRQGLNSGEILCSFYAKLCYAALTDKKNKNISKVRDIASNIENILNSGHGSVIEHCFLNFVVTDCSRVFTHELVRHRVGTAFSQTSGRYVRSDKLKVVIDPILEPAYDLVEEARLFLENWYKKVEERLDIANVPDFTTKKKLTSAMRRMLPNGQANEIGFSVNLRTLRHTIEARTSRHAEWEIRVIFNQIFDLIKNKYPIMFIDSKTETYENLLEITFDNKKI